MKVHADKTQENRKDPAAKQELQQKSTVLGPLAFLGNTNEQLPNGQEETEGVKQLTAYQEMANNHMAEQAPPITPPANNTGLPDDLKAGVENLSGYSLDDVKVHYNSEKPAQIQAHAYAQGTEIHLAPGQEKHLPHETWHVVQQKQGRVQPTRQLGGSVNINDDVGLEKEANVFEAKVSRIGEANNLVIKPGKKVNAGAGSAPVQRALKVDGDIYKKSDGHRSWRPLLTHVNAVIREGGYVMTKAATQRIHEWLEGDDFGITFGDVEELVNHLFEKELLYRGLRGPRLGPRTLGKRPNFKGLVARIPRQEGKARRHVISSSTLGKAIEDSQQGLSEINAFLQRHGEQGVPGYDTRALNFAKRKAWELTHNFVGNLWMGDSALNSAIGFIRAPIEGIIRKLRDTTDDWIPFVGLVEGLKKAQGPLSVEGKVAWEHFAEILITDIQSWAADNGGSLPKEDLINLLSDYEINADLDLPEENPPIANYYDRISDIYLDLLESDAVDIFAPGGTLDQFLNLDSGGWVARFSDDAS